MKYFLAIMVLLSFGVTSEAQPLRLLPTPPGVDPLPPGTVEVQPREAEKVQPPKTEPRRVTLKDGWTYRFDATWTEEGIREWVARKEASRPVVPFSGSDLAATADDSGPWLSRAETEAIKDIWPKAVPFGNLKFYDLPRRYQRLYTMNNGRFLGRDITDLEDHSALLALSGGMERLHGWKSVKGLDIPGKVRVWEELTDVRAFASVPRWRWSFPNGTVAADVLFFDGKIFEVRTQRKTDEGWKTKVYKDLAKAPEGYVGAGKACPSCHDQAGAITDVPGRIYRHVVWGDDNRMSWRPFSDDNTLDRRWPIQE